MGKGLVVRMFMRVKNWIVLSPIRKGCLPYNNLVRGLAILAESFIKRR